MLYANQGTGGQMVGTEQRGVPSNAERFRAQSEGDLVRVLTLGSFDMLHPGHLGLFAWFARIAGGDGPAISSEASKLRFVIVAVNTSGFIGKFKTEPRYTTEERVAMVRGTRYVDEVVVNDGLAQADLILEQRPDMLVIGSDWARKDYLDQLKIDQDWLDEHGIALAYVPRTGNWSSTEMRARKS
jgi:glycerol-3-phosphate cytidylyltransferase-like family protein